MRTIIIFIGAMMLQLTLFSQNIIKGEYFIDNEPGFGLANSFSVNPQSNFLLDSILQPSSLTAGYHKLYLRLKDNYGNWSHTARRNIEVINSSSTLLSGVEYFFNNDPGVGNAGLIYFNTPAADGNFTFNIPLENIPEGAHTLYLRARDNANLRYSITQWQKDSVVTTTGVDSLWSHPATWSNNKVPNSNTVALVYHNVIGDINGFCKSLYIKNTGKLRLLGNKIILVSGH